MDRQRAPTEPQFFELAIDPGRASKEEIQRFLVALCRLDIACGGPGLTFSRRDGDDGPGASKLVYVRKAKRRTG